MVPCHVRHQLHRVAKLPPAVRAPLQPPASSPSAYHPSPLHMPAAPPVHVVTLSMLDQLLHAGKACAALLAHLRRPRTLPASPLPLLLTAMRLALLGLLC